MVAKNKVKEYKAMNKIYYKGFENGKHIFLALMGMPIKPTIPNPMSQDQGNIYSVDLENYWAVVEAITLNAPEIVNPEVVIENALHGFEQDKKYLKGVELKPGDIFDLPSGHEFKVEKIKHPYVKVHSQHARIEKATYETVVRIVKTESGLRNGEYAEGFEDGQEYIKSTLREAIELSMSTASGVKPKHYNDGLIKALQLLETRTTRNGRPEESQSELWEEIDTSYVKWQDQQLDIEELLKQFTISRKRHS